MSFDSVLGGLTRDAGGGSVRESFTLVKSSISLGGLLRFPSHDVKSSGGGVFDNKRKTEATYSTIQVEAGSDDDEIVANRKDKYKRRVADPTSCYNVSNIGPDGSKTTYVCEQDGNDSCYVLISGGNGGTVNVETVGRENWVGRREEERGYKSKLSTLRAASNFHTDESTRLKMLGGTSSLSSKGSGGAKLMSILSSKSRKEGGEDEDDVMADIMGKGEVRRKKTKAERLNEGLTNTEDWGEVKVVQSRGAREELLRDSVFAEDVQGNNTMAIAEDGYVVTGGGNDEEFGEKMQFTSVQVSSVSNYNEIEGKQIGFSGTDKVDQDIVRQGDFGVLYDDVDFEPDVEFNDDVDQEENEIMEDASDNDMDPNMDSSDESVGEGEEAKGFKGKKGTLAMLKRARGEDVEDEEIVGKSGGKTTAYKVDYDDEVEGEEEEEEKRKREDVEEGGGEGGGGKRRKVDLMETDEQGRRKLTKEAVRNEIWLNGGKITMKSLCKTFGIQKKDKGTDRVTEFLRIVAELSKKEKGELVLKQHFQNA
ncbi:hypothetical protein TrCOL_g11260 [Triparma columacea]|uniref:Transcription initiation factor IIF subunit alpha n=1 Tax=Triparma columacea TaxID=722753 RepID=A0A9W7G4W8_9STRA|nr:hypothetical protein TrCOL_g11260 [Triparma columacea]